MRILAASTLSALLALGFTTSASAAPATDTDPALTQTVTADEAAAPQGEHTVIDHGHVDLGPRYANSTWTVLARDDSGQTPVWRDLDDVVFAVPDTAKLDVPDSPDYEFIGAEQVWVVPQQEIAGAPWLGWSTQDPGVVDNVPATVDIVYEGHDGPGHFVAFVQAGNFKGPQILWDSAKTESQPLTVDVNTHTHANWAFTEPGVHRVKLAFTATLKDGTPVGGHVVLRFAVGSAVSIDEAFVDADSTSSPEMTGARSVLEVIGADSGSQSADEPPSSDPGRSSRTLWIILGGALIALVTPLIVVAQRKRTARAQEEALQ